MVAYPFLINILDGCCEWLLEAIPRSYSVAFIARKGTSRKTRQLVIQSILFSIHMRHHALLGAEYFGDMLVIRKTQTHGNLRNRHGGFYQKSSNVIHAYARDFIVDGASEVTFEFQLQGSLKEKKGSGF